MCLQSRSNLKKLVVELSGAPFFLGGGEVRNYISHTKPKGFGRDFPMVCQPGLLQTPVIGYRLYGCPLIPKIQIHCANS